MPTVKELAEELGVSRQAVRDFVKNELGVKMEPRKPTILTVNEASAAANYFAKKRSSNAKDNAAVDQEEYRKLAQRCSDALQECAVLKATLAGLQRENDLLRERLSVADEAIREERRRSLGFWHRLGMKLLGDGKANRTNDEGGME